MDNGVRRFGIWIDDDLVVRIDLAIGEDSARRVNAGREEAWEWLCDDDACRRIIGGGAKCIGDGDRVVARVLGQSLDNAVGRRGCAIDVVTVECPLVAQRGGTVGDDTQAERVLFEYGDI